MGTINLFNFEAQVLGGDILYKVVMICVIIYVLFKIIEIIMKKIKLEEKAGFKVLKIKKYGVEVLVLSLIYCILVPISNYIILAIALKFINYNTDIMNKFLGSILILELLTIIDLLLITKINRIINKYDAGIKSKFVLISFIIIFQYILLLTLFITQAFNVWIEGTTLVDIWLMVWVISIFFYSIKCMMYPVFNKTNLTFYSNTIEILIKTNHYYKDEFTENMIIKGQIRSEKNNVIIMNDDLSKNRTIKCDWIEKINIFKADGSVMKSIEKNNVIIMNDDLSKNRTIKRDWIEKINIFKADGSVMKSIDKNTMKNTIIDYRASKKRKLTLKKNKNPGTD